MKHRALLKLTVSALVMTAGWAHSAQAETVMETIAHNPNLTTATKLIQDAGLADSLGGTGPVTVFAPSNAAFSAIPAGKLAELAGNKEMLKSVLNYHVVAANLTSESINNGPQKTATGDSISLYKAGTFLTVESAVVTQADLKASNGVVQVIDTVLIPPKK
jgi:uncharacterized surface protein with fasciclin (FAS1) repeats